MRWMLVLQEIDGETYVFLEQNVTGAASCTSGGYEYPVTTGWHTNVQICHDLWRRIFSQRYIEPSLERMSLDKHALCYFHGRELFYAGQLQRTLQPPSQLSIIPIYSAPKGVLYALNALYNTP